MSVHVLVYVSQDVRLVVQFVADADAQFACSAYAGTQRIEVLILSPYDLGVVLVDLLIVEVGMVRSIVRIVPIWK